MGRHRRGIGNGRCRVGRPGHMLDSIPPFGRRGDIRGAAVGPAYRGRLRGRSVLFQPHTRDGERDRGPELAHPLLNQSDGGGARGGQSGEHPPEEERPPLLRLQPRSGDGSRRIRCQGDRRRISAEPPRQRRRHKEAFRPSVDSEPSDLQRNGQSEDRRDNIVPDQQPRHDADLRGQRGRKDIIAIGGDVRIPAESAHPHYRRYTRASRGVHAPHGLQGPDHAGGRQDSGDGELPCRRGSPRIAQAGRVRHSHGRGPRRGGEDPLSEHARGPCGFRDPRNRPRGFRFIGLSEDGVRRGHPSGGVHGDRRHSHPRDGARQEDRQSHPQGERDGLHREDPRRVHRHLRPGGAAFIPVHGEGPPIPTDDPQGCGQGHAGQVDDAFVPCRRGHEGPIVPRTGVDPHRQRDPGGDEARVLGGGCAEGAEEEGRGRCPTARGSSTRGRRWSV